MFSNKFTALALAFACFKVARAYQGGVAPEMCTGPVNSPCTYDWMEDSFEDPDDPSSTPITIVHTVSAFCAPNGYCADNGAFCDGATDAGDDQCVNYCGSDNVCGGTGAICNSQAVFQHESMTIECASGHACPVNDPNPFDPSPNPGGEPIYDTCVAAAVPSAMARLRSKAKRAHHTAGQLAQIENYKRAAAAVALPGDMKLE